MKIREAISIIRRSQRTEEQRRKRLLLLLYVILLRNIVVNAICSTEVRLVCYPTRKRFTNLNLKIKIKSM